MLLAVYIVAATSYVIIDSDQVGHLKRIYLGGQMSEGRIIATSGENGPQSEILAPGFFFQPLLNVTHDVELFGVVEIPEDQFGYLLASDGAPLRPGQTYADAFPPDRYSNMLGAKYFIENGGQKGPQITVLPPGRYRLNRYLWEVKSGKVTEIPKGFVGVVKANAMSRVDFGNLTADVPTSCAPTRATDNEGGALSVPLVPVGCIGVWDQPLLPGKYYIHQGAYDVAIVETRVQAWEYQGGFTQRTVDLTVDGEGNIQQSERKKDVAVPDHAADSAIAIKIEGYTIYQQARALVQVEPDNAPFVVASVGTLENVEDRIMTPAIQSLIRDIAGQFISVTEPVVDGVTGKYKIDAEGSVVTRQVYRPIQPLDLIEHRDVLQNMVEGTIRIEGRKAGIEIKEVRFLEPDLPPEILIPSKRQQLAAQLVKTLQEEKKAQFERIAKEQASATANQQPELVKAQIDVQRAALYLQERKSRGDADRQYLEALAQGQKAQALVLGEDRVMMLTLAEKILDALKEKPELVSMIGKLVPNTVVTGDGGGGLAGAAAVLQGLLPSRRQGAGTEP
ncbi:MAG: hypothetical protein WD673_10955 [Alphaproteobacteria bacterium]